MLQYILALITILIFVFLIIRKPKIETYLVYVLTVLPLMDTKILPLEYGLFRTFDIITFIALIVFFKYFSTFRKNDKNWIFFILTILFWALTILGILYSNFKITAIYQVYQLFTIFIYTRFLIKYSLENWKNHYNLIKAFKTGFAVVLIFMALQILIGIDLTYYDNLSENVYNESIGLTRYPGLMYDSQNNGQFLAMGAFFMLVAGLKDQSKDRILSILGFLISVIFVFLAGSRSALGGLFVGILVLFMVANSRIKLVMGIFTSIALVLFLIVSPSDGVFSRTESVNEDLEFRESIWKEAYKIFEEQPLLGIGYGNFESYVTKYSQDLYLELKPGEFFYFNQPENGYLKILAEQGVFAFGIFILFILIPIGQVFNGLLKDKINKNTIYFVAGLSSWLVAFNTVYSLLDYRMLIMVGTLISMMIIYVNKPLKDVQEI